MKNKEKLYLVSESELKYLLSTNYCRIEDYTEVPDGAVGFFIFDDQKNRSIRTWDENHKLSPLVEYF